VLKGSVAVEAGARIVNQFTSTADELYKLNNYIGLPVRKSFYDAKRGSRIPFELPYRERYRRIAQIHKKLFKNNFTRDPDEYEKEVLNSESPFYRMVIRDYSNVAPILWRLMVHVAKEIVRSGPLRSGDRRVKAVIDVAKAKYLSLPRAPS
jgi:hypothetical protein